MKHTRFVLWVLVPSFLLLFIFTVFPIFYGLGISFYDYNPASEQNIFLGLKNYADMFRDELFFKSAINTLAFSVIGVCANIVITLILAQLISVLPKKGYKTLFRTVLFIPCIAPMVGTAVIWKFGILATDGGALNQMLGFLGQAPKNWFGSTTGLLILIILYTLWADIGYNVVLFTAGLEGVPKEFEEAAMIDGAGAVKRFLLIRLPLIGRTFAFVFIMTMANYFQMFAQFKILAPNGGVQNSAMVMTNYVFTKSFVNNNMGYASAAAMALFIIIFTVALIQNKMMRIDWSYE